MNSGPACVVVGLGHHGALLARQITDRGYALVGAVEVNDLVGKDLPTIISGAAEGSVVHPTPAAALAAKPDIAVIAVTVPLGVLVSISREFLAAGVNVVTINPEFFDTAQDWKAELDAVGRETGATLLATGVQDTWWVQMPAVAAGASSEVTRITIEHQVDINTLSPEVAGFIGVGDPRPESSDAPGEAYAPGTESGVLASALQEAARKLGVTPVQTTLWTSPVVADRPVRWRTAGKTVEAGHVIGILERSVVTTDRGLVLEGVLRTALLDGDEVPSDRLTVEGVPNLVLEHKPFPGEQITNIALLNRIPDVIAAPGGVVGAADLPPARVWLSA